MVAVDQRYQKLGLIGHPVAHSISPLLHGAALSYAGIPGEYNLIDVEPNDVDHALKQLVEDGYNGLNVTVPHKKVVYEIVDELTDAARKVKAVNTIGITDGAKLIGHNTDLEGFIRAMRGFIPDGSRATETAVIIGAGGAARAAVWGLIELGYSSITILARDTFQAQVLREEATEGGAGVPISVLKVDQLDEVEVPDAIVNCTSIGLRDNTDVPEWILHLFAGCRESDRTVRFYDMVYSRDKASTLLMDEFASAPNVRAQDGLQMLIEQALSAFEFWTGVKVPEHVMRSAIQR